MQYRLHTIHLNSSIGIWLRSVLGHPNAIIVKEESLLGKEIIAYKEAIARDLLKYENKTPVESFIERTENLQLTLLELKSVVKNLSEEQIRKEREVIIANSIWRSDLADEGKSIEEIQEIERKIEYERFCQRDTLDKVREFQARNLSFSTKSSWDQLINIQEKQDYLKTYHKSIEVGNNAALEGITVRVLQKNSVFSHGFFLRLLFNLKRFLTLSF